MNGPGWPDPREWVGDAPYPWPPAARLEPGMQHTACYTVMSVTHARDATGAACVDLELADAAGEVAGRLPAVENSDWIRAGLYVGVRGTIVDADGWTILDIEDISPVRVALDDLGLFLPRSSADPDALEAELEQLIDSIDDDGLRALTRCLIGADTEVGRGFRLAPAATRNHHAWLGGLFEHTVSVARLCDFAAAHYGSDVDRDLLITGALLHDIGKVREIGARAGFPYTDEGRLLGHIVLGLHMVAEAASEVRLDGGTRLLLEHLIASHQGRFEWQSPREPRILEAFILHYVDDLDAKVDHVRRVLDAMDGGWSEYDRSLRRELLRHSGPGRNATGTTGGRPDERVTTAAPAPPAGPAANQTVAQPAGAGTGGNADPEGPKKKVTPRPGTNTERMTDPAGPKSKAAPRKKARKREAGGGKDTARNRKRGKKRTARRSESPGSGSRKTGGSNRPGAGESRTSLIEPGMPGFIDTDTLDLFDG